MYVQSLTTKDGASYLQDTMDIVLTMTNGKKYKASQSVSEYVSDSEYVYVSVSVLAKLSSFNLL